VRVKKNDEKKQQGVFELFPEIGSTGRGGNKSGEIFFHIFTNFYLQKVS